jgi:hypothetical protein
MIRYSFQQLQDQVLIARASGADRERLRIRRALRGAMQLIRLEHSRQPDEALDAMDRCIDTATRAPRSKRRRGK